MENENNIHLSKRRGRWLAKPLVAAITGCFTLVIIVLTIVESAHSKSKIDLGLVFWITFIGVILIFLIVMRKKIFYYQGFPRYFDWLQIIRARIPFFLARLFAEVSLFFTATMALYFILSILEHKSIILDGKIFLILLMPLLASLRDTILALKASR